MMEPCCSRFTAAEGGARLAAAASSANTLAVEYASFISTRLVYEHAYKIRGPLSEGRQRSVYVTRASRVPVAAYELRLLTDLAVCAARRRGVGDWREELETNEVLVCTSAVLKEILEDQILTMRNINVLVLDSCHLVCKDECLQYIMKLYKQSDENERPRILALTYPLFPKREPDQQATSTESSKSEQMLTTIEENDETVPNYTAQDLEPSIETTDTQIDEKPSPNTVVCENMGAYENLDDFEMYEKLEWKIEELEKQLCCQMDLAEDIDGGKRLSATVSKPKELIIEYGAPLPREELPQAYVDLEAYMRQTVDGALQFLEEHRYDPTEIYGEEMYDEFKNIPDPVAEPRSIFQQFLYVLDQLGPYAADKAAFSLLTKLEKLKIKVPYERHFLLLCLCTSVLVKIRCYADSVFSNYESDWEKIQLFCTSKVLRFAEVLEKFQPLQCAKSESNANVNSENVDSAQTSSSSGIVNSNFADQRCCSRIVNSNSADAISNSAGAIRNSGIVNSKSADAISNSGIVNSKSADAITNSGIVNSKSAGAISNSGIVNSNSADVISNSRNVNSISADAFRDSEIVNSNSADAVSNYGIVNSNSDDAIIISGNSNQRDKSSKSIEMLKEIDNCNFMTLGNKIEDRVNTYEANLKEIPNESEAKSTVGGQEVSKISIEMSTTSSKRMEMPERLERSTEAPTVGNNSMEIPTYMSKSKEFSMEGLNRGVLGFSRRTGNRARGRGRVPRNVAARVQQMQLNPDALCGIVYLKEALMAKIMFMLIVDMSRCCARLSLLCAQYCAADVRADSEPRECQRKGRKWEDVLKKFRMHECNLLLATPALEEGIDLPRCNLVLRWDLPPSYRSYGLCRGRARAPRAACAVLCQAARTPEVLHNVATYTELDQIISRKCGCGVQNEPSQTEEDIADSFTLLVKPYTPNETNNKQVKDTRRNSNKDSIDNCNVNFHEANIINNEKCGEMSNCIAVANKCDNGNIDIDTQKRSDLDTNSEVIDNRRNENDTVKRNLKNTDNVDGNLEVLVKGNVDNDLQKLNLPNIETVNANSEVILKGSIDNDAQTQNLMNNENSDVDSEVNDNGIDNDTQNLNLMNTENVHDSDENVNNDDEKLVITNAHNIPTDIDNSSILNHDIMHNSKYNNTNLKINCDISDNTFCNKCNSVSRSVSVVCPCVDSNVPNLVGTKKAVNSPCVDSNVSNVVGTKKVVNKTVGDAVSVDLSTAIALINRYCGKLPSDTFTRLAPQWWMERVRLPARDGATQRAAFVCTLRLPLNCPVKYNIVGHPMPTRVLARRMVALQACRILHKSGELDDQLMPIGKENFKAAELESTSHGLCGAGDGGDLGDAARPGTTKRRQYYYKRTAWAFTDCQPVLDTSDSELEAAPGARTPETKPEVPKEVPKGTKRNMLYALVSTLWCALPERYNTRGRRLHAPQHAAQAIGVLMARHEPDSLQIPAFPVYTRSGEVRVSVEHVPDADVRMSPRRARLVRRFMRFVFAEVLRVRRRGMKLQTDGSAHNNYYIVPTAKTTRPDGTTKIDIDWAFLDLIYQYTEDKKITDPEKPLRWHPGEEDEEGDVDVIGKSEKDKEESVKKMENPLLKPGETFVFDAEKYREAVVTPWYRNQDQPQFFLVAEICWNLSPDSAFPSATHTSFRDYYRSKYGVSLTQSQQPLLDVDHTSARLNLLTPRYVNRKGVALPVSSERTRRAKRDRLDQKQILVPELCRVHPFAAPLWFATVALPCVLYRINALLIADEIRRAVAIDVGLGIPKIDEQTCAGFQWPPLDFGWSLAEVLSADSEKTEKKNEEDESVHTEKKDDDKEESATEEETASQGDPEEKTLNDILQKEVDENGFEIGTWSNDMASSLPQSRAYDEYLEPLPSNLTFCTSASGGTNWCDPIEKPTNQFNPSKAYSMANSDSSYMSSDFDTDDSDLNSEVSDDDTDTSGFCSSKNSNAAMGVRIEYKTAHEAEAVDLEIKNKTNPAPQPDEREDALDKREHEMYIKSGSAPVEYIEKFHKSVARHKQEIVEKGLVRHSQSITNILPESPKLPNEIQHNTVLEELARNSKVTMKTDQELEDLATTLSKTNFSVDFSNKELIDQIFPYGKTELSVENGQITLETIEKSKRLLLEELRESLPEDEVKKLNCFSMVDVDISSPNYVNEKVANIGFDSKENYRQKINNWEKPEEFKPYYQDSKEQKEFDFDYQPELEGHPGPSPSVILQALTMSNANDGINLERLETIGDSFLKFAITAYLYCAHPTVHEGKLSHMRSKQVSNLNLYRLGRDKRLGARMIASKFEPHDNWLPPCHQPPPALHHKLLAEQDQSADTPLENTGCFIPYNLITQHSIPDKSIADCVEALIGAYLLECGPRGALLFMSWLGIRVLPRHELPLPAAHPYVRAQRSEAQEPSPPPSPRLPAHCSSDSDSSCRAPPAAPARAWGWRGRAVGSLRPYRDTDGVWLQPIFGELKAPPSPLLRYIADPDGELERMLSGYDALERTLRYRFQDRSLLLQALTHASHQQNRLTDCYQRLEFLGDAILDYLITRHLYEDPRRHSPGALTDLRSALVNNTIFATLAARHGFHKYFRHMSPGLNEVLTKYVKIQEENGHSISEEHYLIQEDEMEQAEDVEVPKALGDLFESVAGAIFLDSGMSLGAVWKSYVTLMGAELEAFSAAAPKSPVRELLEAEPDTAKFGKPERLADGRRVRVCVEVFGRGAFKGVGRNYRIAKGTAARCALRHLKINRAR